MLPRRKGYGEVHGPRSVRAWVLFLCFPKFRATFWQAVLLSDLGLDATNPPIKEFADLRSEYRLRTGPPLHVFREEASVAGNAARKMTRFGYADDRRVRKLYDR